MQVQETIFDRGVLVNLRIRKWGASAKADKSLVIKDTLNKDVIRAVQDLIQDRTILEEINTVRSKVKTFIRMNSIPFPVDGMFFIPTNMVENINNQLIEFKEQYDNLVSEFVMRYSALVEQFKKSNPLLYNPNNYPNESVLSEKFSFEWSFRELRVSDQLPEKIKKEEMTKFKKEVIDIKESCKNIVASEMYKRLESLAKQCENNKFNNSTLQGINNFLERFDNIFKGFFDQRELEKLLGEIKVYVSGVTADDLRADEEFKAVVQKKMQEAVAQLEAMPDVKLQRGIDLEDND